MHLLKNGEKQDESNTNNVRQKALVLLCRMQPSKTLLIRNRCIEMCKMPSLALGNRNQKNLKNFPIRILPRALIIIFSFLFAALTLEQQAVRSNPINIVSFMTGLLLGKDIFLSIFLFTICLYELI